ncbi:GCYA2 cyclase, partial [Polypterus senegalus]
MERTCQHAVERDKHDKESKKRARKQMRAAHTVLRHAGISTVSYATQSLVIANGGLGNGVSRERLLDMLKGFGSVLCLLMPPNKPYAFVKYDSFEDAKMAFLTLNGCKLQAEGQPVTLYVNFVDKVDFKEHSTQSLPPDLLVVEDFVSLEYEQELLHLMALNTDTQDTKIKPFIMAPKQSATASGAVPKCKRKMLMIAEKAKEKYEKEERRKELKRARGEDTWMLPDVDMRLKEFDEDSEGDWVEVNSRNVQEKSWKINSDQNDTEQPSSSSQRDEWMTFDFLTMKTVSTSFLRAEKEKIKEDKIARQQEVEKHQRVLLLKELCSFVFVFVHSPALHYGSKMICYCFRGRAQAQTEDVNDCRKATAVNDGGLSWLKKSYQRMKEQALRDKRSLEEVVAERYGSMEEFKKRLEEAEKAYSTLSRDKEQESSRKTWRKHAVMECRKDDLSEDRSVMYKNQQCIREEVKEGCQSKASLEGKEKKESWRAQTGLYKSWKKNTEGAEQCLQSRSELNSNRDSRGKKPVIDETFLKQRTLTANFLKPSDLEDTARPNTYSRGEVSIASTRSMLGFQKPSEDDVDNVVKPWHKQTNRSGEKTEERQGAPIMMTTKEDKQIDLKKNLSKLEKRPQAIQMQPEPPEKLVSFSGLMKDEEKETPVHVLSDEEINKLAAKLIKAEMLGDTDLANKLKAQLDSARKSKENLSSVPKKVENKSKALKEDTEDHEVALFRTDRSGTAWPINASSQLVQPRGGHRRKQLIETHRGNERMRYFHDDDNIDLQEMVKQEKMGTAEDQNALYSRLASKLMGKLDRDYHTLDDMFVSSVAQKSNSGEDERHRQAAIREHRRLAERMEKCPFCFDSSELPKHLIISIGSKVYLCLPNCVSLVEGHCLIVPLQHHTAATSLDEDIWQEIQAFRKSLVEAFKDKGLDCVFLETHMNPKQRRHMVYECIPLPREIGDMAPIYFKKAIMESDEEWAMNKKVIDLSSRDVRRAVPKGLPYFSVDFGLQGGFAHVIENRDKFPHYFGKTPTLQQALQRTLHYYKQHVIRYNEDEKELERISSRCQYLERSTNEDMADDISGILQCTATLLGVSFEELRERFGEEFFTLCFEENERVLRAVGSTLQDFFNGFDALLEHIRTSCGKKVSSESPSFLCKELSEDSSLMLHYFHPFPIVGFAMPGMIKATASRIYSMEVQVEQVVSSVGKLVLDGSNPGNSNCLSFLIKICQLPEPSKNPPLKLSRSASDLKIGLSTFYRAFPFHLMLDAHMTLLQLGEGLRKQIKCEVHRSLNFHDCFEVVSPKIPCNFQAILLRLSTPFVIRTKPESSELGHREKVMEIKGQMIHVPESSSILFLGSPCVDKLEELMGRGLHLSDIPIHDMTRDVILVGEQARAQDGLKKRMDKLKATLEKTHQALEEEKKKTVDLLYSIFPGDVAQQLWQEKTVQARKFDDVTMLFSDIVGFTAVCAQCTPMQVISMLNELYTRFDYQCGILDVYKIETIGDAYCVAGGLHKKSDSHAKPIALMALKMMELSEEVLTPDGKPIKSCEYDPSPLTLSPANLALLSIPDL